MPAGNEYGKVISDLGIVIEKYHFEALTGLLKASTGLSDNPL